ncbi:MAG: four helix bundle protein [Microgenomates group bacterium]
MEVEKVAVDGPKNRARNILCHKGYLKLENLKVYQLAKELSRIVWKIYLLIDRQTKDSRDKSIGANIVEGFGRFHFLDKNKFYFNARGSCLESKHWLELLKEREKVGQESFSKFVNCYNELHPALNGLIDSIKKSKIKTLITNH